MNHSNFDHEIGSLNTVDMNRWKQRKVNDLIWDTLAFVGIWALLYLVAIVIF